MTKRRSGRAVRGPPRRRQRTDVPDYRLRITFPGDHVVEIDDPYRYGRVLTDFDLHLFGEGHAPSRVREARRAPHHASARRPACTSRSGRPTPSASASSATSTAGTAASIRCGCWCRPASGRSSFPICRTARSTSSRSARRPARCCKKTDPFGVAFEVPPQTASVVRDISRLRVARRRRGWRRGAGDGAWLERPMSIYEVHLGSWARVPEEGNRFLTYRELAHRLVPYVKETGLHAHRAAAGDGASVLGLVGLSGARLLRADQPLRPAGRLQATSSTPAIRPASA